MRELSEKKLPKAGDKISVEKFHVSKMNVRADEPFGNAEQDRLLIAQLRRGRIIGPFKARPEGNGYGVVVGRRRFLGKREAGAEELVVGADCIIEDMSDEEARESSLIENLSVLRKEMDPVTRAKRLNEIITYSPVGLRGVARRLGIPATTLSEWLKPLQLTPKMQKALTEDHIFFTDAVQLARLKLGKEKQNELAELAEKEGQKVFKSELTKISGKGLRRGIPPGKYIILRTTFDKRYKPDLELYENLTKLAEAKHQKIDEYAKWVLQEHVKTAS